MSYDIKTYGIGHFKLVVWVVTPCGLVSGYRFGGTYCLHLQACRQRQYIQCFGGTYYIASILSPEDGGSMFNVSGKYIASILSPEDGGSMFLRNVDIYIDIFASVRTSV
jgi:hypothetical protein